MTARKPGVQHIDQLAYLRCLDGWTAVRDIAPTKHSRNHILKCFRDMLAKGWVEKAPTRKSQPVAYRITPLGQQQLDDNKPNPWLALGKRIDLGPEKHKSTGPKASFYIWPPSTPSTPTTSPWLPRSPPSQ